MAYIGLFIVVVGIIIPSGRCQFPNMEGLTANMPNNMAEMMQWQMLMNAGNAGSGSGRSASGSSSNPIADAMMYQAVLGGGGGANMGEGMSNMLLLGGNSPLANLFGGEQTGSGSGNSGTTGIPSTGMTGTTSGMPGMTGAMTMMPSGLPGMNLASMYGFQAQQPTITPAEKVKIVTAIISSGHASKLARLANPDLQERVQLEKDGIKVPPAVAMAVCPRKLMMHCSYPICADTPENYYLADTYYVCQGCPRCPMESSRGNMMRMLSNMFTQGNRRGMSAGTNPMTALLQQQGQQTLTGQSSGSSWNLATNVPVGGAPAVGSGQMGVAQIAASMPLGTAASMPMDAAASMPMDAAASMPMDAAAMPMDAASMPMDAAASMPMDTATTEVSMPVGGAPTVGNMPVSEPAVAATTAEIQGPLSRPPVGHGPGKQSAKPPTSISKALPKMPAGPPPPGFAKAMAAIMRETQGTASGAPPSNRRMQMAAARRMMQKLMAKGGISTGSDPTSTSVGPKKSGPKKSPPPPPPPQP